MDERAIASVWADLDGDGKTEEVTLVGERPEGQLAWQNLKLVIGGGVAAIPLPDAAAYDPYLAAGRFTSGRREQVLVVLPTGGSGGIVNFFVYGLENGEYVPLLSADQYAAEYPYAVTYLNGYRALVTNEKSGAEFLIDLSGRDAEYLNGLYDETGRLKAPQAGFVEPVSLIYPADVDGNGVLELVTWQQVSGLYHADQLGFVIHHLQWDGKAFAPVSQVVAVPPIRKKE